MQLQRRQFGEEVKGRGKRERVAGFSHQARRRLMQFMGKLDQGATAEHRYFVTLTYPAPFPASAETWKRDLHNFVRRLARQPGYEAHLWKLEPQKRGAPHFHLVVFMRESLDSRWCGYAWHECVGTPDENHLVYGCDVEELRSWEGVTWYVSSYLAKPAAVPDELAAVWAAPGRWWGKGGTFHVHAVGVDLTDRQAFAVRRVIRRWVTRQTGRRWRTWGRSGATAYMRSDTQADLQEWALAF